VSVISTNDVAYLPGLHAARPSAFVEGDGLEPPAHPKLFRESPPLWSDAVAFVSAMGQTFPLFQFCRFAPLFRLSLPNMSILIALCFRKPANLTAGWEVKSISTSDVLKDAQPLLSD
jgi:hypothetical protein